MTIAHCQWCGREMEVSKRGRRRKFCSQACRQRAYEKRAGVPKGASMPAAVRINAAVGQVGQGGQQTSAGQSDSAAKARAAKAIDDVVKRIGDGLYEVRCLAEDLRTALADGADNSLLEEITQELIIKTREVERFIP